MIYLTIKYVHIFLAIIAVGFNASYALWLARARMQPEHELFALTGIKLMDDRIANPCYGFLLITGGLMVWLGNIPLTSTWIVGALILYFGLLALGAGVYTPTLKKQIQTLQAEGPQSPQYIALAKRGQLVGQLLFVLVAALIVLMVFKPVV